MDRTLKLTWLFVAALGLGTIACGDDEDSSGDAGGDAHVHEDDSGAPGDDDDAGAKPDPKKLSFFVSSDTSKTGNLGGLKGADERCAKLAKAAGSTRKFQAYL